MSWGYFVEAWCFRTSEAKRLGPVARFPGASRHRLEIEFSVHVRLGGCRDQCSGVRMSRVVEDTVGGAFLDNPTTAHHQHTVGKRRYHRQIVADEEIAQTHLGP